MTDNISSIRDVLNDHATEIGAQIGADPAQTQGAIAAALPALLAGLQGNAASDPGLQQAVDEDHDGSILDDIAGYLQGTAPLSSRTTNGAGILEHVLGDRQPGVQQALSSQTGLSSSSIAQLLPLLAPIVMGLLGRNARSQQSSDGSADLGGILGGLLGGAGGSGGLGDLLGGLLGGTRQR